MRVAICDDSALFRNGLAGLLETAGVAVAFQSRTGPELVTLLARPPAPDVVIVDIRMPPSFTDEGLQAALEVRRRYPGTAVLVLSTYAETAYAATLLEECTGAVGYLLKDRVDDLRVLLDALHRVTAGETVVDPDIVRRLLDRSRRDTTLDRLTPREHEVLEQMALGRSNVGIARELGLGVKSVERHINHLLQQLDLASDTADNRRVLAVLTWLRSGDNPRG
jgi:DNA-binding NarL/FixJ family response regulator